MNQDATGKEAENILNTLRLSQESIDRLRDLLRIEIVAALSKDPVENKKSSIPMFPTGAEKLPDGQEKGEYLTIFLGSRFLYVRLYSIARKKVTLLNFDSFAVLDTMKSQEAKGFFYFIAKNIKNFLNKTKLCQKALPLACSFSCGIKQINIKSATIVKWQKGMSSDGLIGKDIGQLLEEALHNTGCINVHLVAICSDSVALLLAGSFSYPTTRIALYISNGCNIAYIEDIANVEKWKDNDPTCGADNIIVNTLISMFGSNGSLEFLQTAIDKNLDEASDDPGQSIFSKLTDAFYMGEIVRRYLVLLAERGILFKGRVPQKLLLPNVIELIHINRIGKDNASFKNTTHLLDDLEIQYDASELPIVKSLCLLVVERSAHLMAVAIAEFLAKINEREVTIAVDGSLYTRHPTYKIMLEKKLRGLVAESQCNFTIRYVKDGIQCGAAILAAVEDRKIESRKGRRLKEFIENSNFESSNIGSSKTSN